MNSTKDSKYLEWFIKGLMLQETGEDEHASYCFTKSVALNPSYADGWFHIAEELFKNGDYKKAYEHYEIGLNRKLDLKWCVGNIAFG